MTGEVEFVPDLSKPPPADSQVTSMGKRISQNDGPEFWIGILNRNFGPVFWTEVLDRSLGSEFWIIIIF